MAVLKRGEIYWYEFRYRGERIRESTKQSNKRTAEQLEAAHKTQLAMGNLGIEEPAAPAPMPVFRAYAEGVIARLKAEAKNDGTVSFYESKLKRLLEFPALADCPLDAIGKKLINEYKVFARRTKTRARTVDGKRVKQPYQISPATVNRTLATLRMILYQALDEDVIEAVPKIGKAMLKGERQREFVLSPAEEPFYLEACPEPLQDAALLILDTGLRDGEALSLSWPDIHLEHAGSKLAMSTFARVRARTPSAISRSRRGHWQCWPGARRSHTPSGCFLGRPIARFWSHRSITSTRTYGPSWDWTLISWCIPYGTRC
jgi:integrase